MLERLLLQSPWVAVVVAALAFAAEQYATIYESHLYHLSVEASLTYEGLYRLSPQQQAILARQRLISGRLLAILAVLIVGVYSAWWALTQQIDRPDVFLLLMGGLVLSELAELSWSYRQIMFFREVRRRGGLQGQIKLTRQLSVMSRVFDQYAFVMLYLVLFLLTGSWMLLGGAVACFVSSRRLRDWAVIKA